MPVPAETDVPGAPVLPVPLGPSQLYFSACTASTIAGPIMDAIDETRSERPSGVKLPDGSNETLFVRLSASWEFTEPIAPPRAVPTLFKFKSTGSGSILERSTPLPGEETPALSSLLMLIHLLAHALV